MKIGFIAPYKELVEIAQKMERHDGVSLMISEATYTQALDEMRRMEEEGAEAIISRGSTCAYLERCSDVPVINCNYGVVDLLYALREARKFGRKIGIVTFMSYQWLKNIFEDLYQIDLTFMEGYRDEKEILTMVKQLQKTETNVIVGGSVTVEIAEQCGMHGVLVHTRPETVELAVDEAVRVVRAIRKEHSELEKIAQIIETITDAIILIDDEGKVLLMNPSARATLLEWTGKENITFAAQIPAGEEFLSGIRKHRTRRGEIHTICGVDMLINQTPLIIGEEYQGVVLILQKVSAIQKLEGKIRTHFIQKGFNAKYQVQDFLGVSAGAATCREKAVRYGTLDLTVLILGESGTGKEILAQSIHNASRRKNGPFVAVNCSAISGNLLESELFGYAEGAFTGAKKGGKIGLFEQAHTGTIFLDEIGNISLEFQAGLLRVLQEKEIRRVGSDKVVPVDVRVLAATNCDLLEAVRAGKFRLDLYYRLCVLELRVPPLRERREDIAVIAEAFCRRFGRDYRSTLEPYENRMRAYDWPGNVRELRNFIERVCALTPGIPLALLMEEQFRAGNPQEQSGGGRAQADRLRYLSVKRGTLEEMERDILRQIYEECGCNKTLAASLLKISRVTVWNKIGKEEDGAIKN